MNRATLRFWLYPLSGSLGLVSSLVDFLAPVFPGLAPADADYQYVSILNPDHTEIRRLLYQKSNSQTWEPYEYDLSDYAGQTVIIHFGVYNDNAGGVTGMYVDDASLNVCP